MASPFARAPMLGAALLLAACGGGGGGGGQAAPPANPPANPPVNPPASFTLSDANAVDAASFALGAVEEAVTAGELFAGAINALLSSGRTQVTYVCIGSQPSGTPAGTARYVDNDGTASFTASDRVAIEIVECAGTSTNVDATVATLSAAGFSASATFDVTRSSSATRAQGSVTYSSAAGSALTQPTLTLAGATVDYTTGGTVEKIQVIRADKKIDGGFHYTVSFVGTVQSARFGASFSFETAAPLIGDYGSMPAAGEVLLAAGASRARFSAPNVAPGARMGVFQVDPGGAGYGADNPVDWSTLVRGVLFRWVRNDPPHITSFDLTPASPKVQENLTVAYSATDPDGDFLFYTVEWRINGQLLGYSGNSIYLNFRKGDVVEATLIANDGRLEARATRTTTIANTPPTVTVSLVPAAPNAVQPVTATPAGSDIDSDTLSYSYAWLRNDQLVANLTTATFPASATHLRGDELTVVVTASDGEATATVEQSTTVVDAPPMVVMGSPTAPAALGLSTPTSFDTNVIDPDGDSVSGLRFKLAHGPAGMTLNATTGAVTWTPQLPLFDETLDVHWAVTLESPSAAVPLAGTIRVEDPGHARPLMRMGFDLPQRNRATVLGGDFDSDGDDEALILSNRALYQLERDGSGGYRQSWVYPFTFYPREYGYFTRDASAIATGDVDHDGMHEIFVATERSIVKLDGVERRPVASAALGENDTCADLKFGDIDRNGAPELVCVTESLYWQGWQPVVLVIDAGDMSVRAALPAARYGQALALGNVDADLQLEIVTAGGYVIDGQSLATQWYYQGTPGGYDYGFGFDLEIADLDGNGVDEIVASVDWEAPVRVYSAVTQSTLFDYVHQADVGGMTLGDLDGDGTPEAIVGPGQGDFLTVYELVSNGAQVAYRSPYYYNDLNGIVVGDFDDDGHNEALLGSGYNHSAGPLVIIGGATLASLDVEWSPDDPFILYGPFFGGDLMGNSLNPRWPVFGSVRTASATTILDATRLLRMNPATGDLEASADIGWNANGEAVSTVSDYDADGNEEVVLSAADGYSGYLVGYDFFGDAQEWSTPPNQQQYGYPIGLAAADLLGDSRPEIVTMSKVGLIEVLDPNTNSVLWQSTTLGDGRYLVMADVDGDADEEIVALTAHGVYLYRRNPSPSGSRYLQAAYYLEPNTQLQDIAVGDVDGDGEVDVMVLAAGYIPYTYDTVSEVRRLDSNLGIVATFPVPWRARSIQIEPSTSARKNLLVPTGFDYQLSATQIVALDALSGAEVWRSPKLRGSLSDKRVRYVTIPGESRPSITIATDAAIYLTR
jgi:hypothetical protein